MTSDDSAPSDAFKTSFIRLLLEDVIAARSNFASDDQGGGRRNLVRTTFAAIEGALWLVREHVLEIAGTMDTLAPLADMALREQTYVVTSRGAVIEQMRAVAMSTTIRLIENQARLIAPKLQVRYDHSGWSALQTAIRIRNRITHPKSVADLHVIDADLRTMVSGFHWFLATVEYIMAATSSAHRSFADDRRATIEALIAGDPETRRAYEEALRNPDKSEHT